MKKQHYMTWEERQKLEALRRARVPVGKIAGQLGFCRQTIYNELKLGAYEHEQGGFLKQRYSPEKAEQLHRYAQTAKGRPLKIGHNQAYANFLERKMLHERYSPAAALASARKAGFTLSVCTATLYSYIDKGVFLHLTNKDLWVKSKRKKHAYRPVHRIAHPGLPSITDRPGTINSREELGHWEMDLVVSKAGSRAALLTLTERATRQELIFKIPNRKAETVCAVFNRLERSLGKRAFLEQFKSITTDNGVEFLEYENLCRSIYGGRRFEVYYCHSYAAWEKGSSENHNRMIRRWFPKGTDFTDVKEKDVIAVQDWMNHYPRKVLGWCAPCEIA